MKALKTTALTILLILSLTTAALADIIWYPEGNRFFETNETDCTSHFRVHIINGEDGYAELYDAPGDKKPVSTLPNGESYEIYFTYDGKWGLVDYLNTGAWVELDSTLLEYDYISFSEEFGTGFVEFDGDYGEIEEGMDAVMYSWPGSDYCFEAVLPEEPLSISETYTDENGLRWGYVGYHMWIRSAWICIDEPTSKAHAGELSREPENLIPAADPASVSEDRIPVTWVVIGFAVVFIALVAILIPRLYKKKT